MPQTLDLLPASLATEYTNLLAILCQLTGTTNDGCHTGGKDTVSCFREV